MKLTIPPGYKVAGALIVLVLLLIPVLIMLGKSYRWFSRDYDFITYFPSASGLSRNMPVQYRGFTIGRVKSFELTQKDDIDQVEVYFTIFETYKDRVREGSLVEVVVSPLGALMGNQFLFHPGPDRGTNLISEKKYQKDMVIFSITSPEGNELLDKGLAQKPESDNMITNMLNSFGINDIITHANEILITLDEALKGTDKTSLGQTMAGLQSVAEKLPGDLENIMTDLEPLLVNFRELSEQLTDPDSAIAAILDSEGDVYQDLVKTLDGLAGFLKNLDTTTSYLPSQIPQITALVADIRNVAATMENVLVGMTNNPLIKQGIPERKETNAGGTYNRDLEF